MQNLNFITIFTLSNKNKMINLNNISGRISDDLVVCYADKDGYPDGQASINSRTENKDVGIYSLSKGMFLTKPSSSISEISKEFSKVLGIDESVVKKQMVADRDLDRNIPNSPAIPFND